MHGRSRMTMDPRTPTMPGRSTSGVHRPGRQLHKAQSAVRCSTSRMKGEPNPTKNSSWGGPSMHTGTGCIEARKGQNEVARDQTEQGRGQRADRVKCINRSPRLFLALHVRSEQRWERSGGTPRAPMHACCLG